MVRLSYCSKGSKNCMEGQRKTSLTAAPLVTLTEEDWHSWCIRVWRNSVMVKVSYISETIIGVWNTAAVVSHHLLTVMPDPKVISFCPVIHINVGSAWKMRAWGDEKKGVPFLSLLAIVPFAKMPWKSPVTVKWPLTKREAWGRVSLSATSHAEYKNTYADHQTGAPST